MAGGEAEFGEEMNNLIKKRPEESHVSNLLGKFCVNKITSIVCNK